MRLKFSVRTLAIFVTFVCAYFGAWEMTKRYASTNHKAYTVDGRGNVSASDGRLPATVGQVTAIIKEVRIPAPFFIIQDEIVYDFSDRQAGIVESGRTLYFFWLLGPKVKLPYQSTFESHSLPVL